MSDPYRFMIGSSSQGIRLLSDADDSSSYTTHLQVVSLRNGEYLLKNIGNTDDIVVNREKVVMARVAGNTRIDIVGKTHFSIKDLKDAGKISIETGKKSEARVRPDRIESGQIYSAGASDECPIFLPSPRVAWKSFDLERKGDNWFVYPAHGSRKPILWEKDKSLKVGPYQLNRQDDRLNAIPFTDNRLDLSSIYVHKYGKDLANYVSLSIRSKELVGIVGPSGAGKSILLKAIRGIEPITSGDILINAQNVSANKQLLREIGFVCQNDIVYDDLTVEENIVSAARFRLPSDWTEEAVRNRADQVIRQLSLEDCRERRVANISGGQKKRVNLANELVWEPDFILADEVCSGLSAYDTNNIVRHLRNIADSGKIVLLTIHTPDIETLDYMDMLLVYDKGGYIAYYGPAKEAMKYFSREHYSPHKSPKLIFDVLEKEKSDADILKELEKAEQNKSFKNNMLPPHEKSGRKTSPKDWHELYRKSAYYRDCIESRLKSEKPESGTSPKASVVSLPKSFLKQIFYLTHRRLLTFFRDKADVAITLGQAPLMALAFFLVFSTLEIKALSDFFQPLRRYTAPDIIIFLAVIAAVWFGFDKAISEIPSSKIFYNQESLTFLSNPAFIISRFTALSIITFGQVLLFAIFFHTEFIVIPNFMHHSADPFLSKFAVILLMKFIILLWLTSVASVAMAMVISFFIPSSSAAKAILPFIIILQILFGGSRIQPLYRSDIVYGFSQTMVSRWGFEAAVLLFEYDLKWVNNDGDELIVSSEKHSLLIEASQTIDEEVKDDSLKKKIKILLKRDFRFNDYDRELWERIVKMDYKIRLFRPPNTKSVWIRLCIIPIMMLIILSVLYEIGRWKNLIPRICRK